MSSLTLPIHPSLRHPLTGAPLRALYVDKHGRARYPIMGGDETADAAAKAAADAAKATADADAKAAADAAAAKAAEDAKKTDDGKDLGFPKDTPVADMKPTEQAAYHLHQSRKHEDRNKEMQKALGGKTAAEVQKDLEELATLRAAAMTDNEKAVAAATTEGRRAASLELAPQFFDVALSHIDEERRKVLISNIDLSKVITETGSVDTDKVKTIAESLAPADTGGDKPRIRNFGAGDRRTDQTSGVAAGRSLFQERRGKKTTQEASTD